MASTEFAGFDGSAQGGSGFALVSRAVAYGDSEPLPEPLVQAILGAWKNRARTNETPAQRDQRFQNEALPHMRMLYGSAYRMVGNAHDAEDLVQETFLRAYRAFAGFTPGTNIRAWLYTILQRVRTDAFRRRLRSVETFELEDDGPGVAPQQDALARGGEEIERALEALPAVFGEAVVLRDVQEFSYGEIAAILEVPVGTVMSRIHRGRALLRKSLAHLRPG